jgi:hypothetical protein
MTLNHKYYIKDLQHIIDLENGAIHDKPVYIKFSPLIDSLRVLTGKYNSSLLENITLPKIPTIETGSAVDLSNNATNKLQDKICDPNNASYVDNFFSFLSSMLLNQHGFIHGIDYYGSFLGIQQKYKSNITDDLDFLQSSKYFLENNHSLFHAKIDAAYDEYNSGSSRKNKHRLVICEDDGKMDIDVEFSDIPVFEVEEIQQENCAEQETTTTTTPTEEEVIVVEEVYEKKNSSEDTEDDDMSDNTSNNSEINYSTEDENENHSIVTGDEDNKDSDTEDWETDIETDVDSDDDEDYSEEMPEQYAYVNNFPVQLICLEKCQGTLDELLDKSRLSSFELIACLFQIIMILLTYQKAFDFTHNDLHTNNIMYIETKHKYLYYRYASKLYKVPTFGKIYKIIDFGRSVYKYKGHTLFSDSFAPGGDAATQYNVEPFYNEKKPRIEPNMSFDLCRLGTSIYDFLFDDDDDVEDTDNKKMDEIKKTILRWCTDDNGKNILYKSNGEERYPSFKLYKMIARTVHNHRPEMQLDFPLFKQFSVNEEKEKIKKNDFMMDIDSIPKYI